MSSHQQFVVFSVADQRCAVAVLQVERIVRAVAIAPLPRAPTAVEGVINVNGRIVPVFSVRRRCRLPVREIELSDYLIIARTRRLIMALLVDSVEGVIDISKDAMADGNEIVPGMEFVRGVAKLPDGLLLLHDLERFIDEKEEQALKEALSAN